MLINRVTRYDSLSGVRCKPVSNLKKIGTDYSGWVVPTDVINEDSICYCVGCGEDISFDLELIDRFGCQVFGFDPTPRAIEYVRKHANQSQGYRFFDIGLWDQEEELKLWSPKDPAHVSHSALNLQKTDRFFLARVKRLKDIMHENQHATLDLLKLDIEGAEYRVLQSLVDDDIRPKILCVEYDEWMNPLDNGYFKRVRNSIRSIVQWGYVLVYSDARCNYTFLRNE